MSDIVENAKRIAVLAHMGQEYGDVPYSVFLEQEAQAVQRLGGTEEEIAAAYLQMVFLQVAIPAEAVADFEEIISRECGSVVLDLVKNRS